MNRASGKLWTVAGGLAHFEQIAGFLRDSEEFYNLQTGLVHAVYDSHAGLPWNGGRYLAPFPFSMEESVRRVAYYNKQGIAFNIAFSNRCLTPADLDDEDCNWFLERCQRPGNGVIVASDLLRQYVRSTFPSYKVIASVGFCRTDEAFYREAQQRYDVVVLHPDLNRQPGLLDRLDVEKLEVLVNEFCVARCPCREEHAQYICEIIKAGTIYFRTDSDHLGSGCLATARGYKRRNELVLGLQEVEALRRRGVRRFKIQGREHAFEAVLYPALRNLVVRDAIRTLCGTA